MPSAFRARIFDKFFRLEHHHTESASGARGAGIGLYMCRQIVELHGGQIACGRYRRPRDIHHGHAARARPHPNGREGYGNLRPLMAAAARADTIHGNTDDYLPSSKFTMLMVAVTIGVAIQRPITFAAQDPQPVFKAGVALVPITALVRDSRNRIVRNLGLDDFQVFEGGRPRPIVDFAASDNAPINVAFLFDTSGSMHVASNLARGKDFVEEFVGGMEPAADRVALFTFDKSLRREVPFTKDRDEVYDALGGVKPWGLTSLYDAIAETAKQLGDRTSERRAVVVITDGVDTSSALTPAEVSGLASSIDVPVYVVAVVCPWIIQAPRPPSYRIARMAGSRMSRSGREEN